MTHLQRPWRRFSTDNPSVDDSPYASPPLKGSQRHS